VTYLGRSIYKFLLSTCLSLLLHTEIQFEFDTQVKPITPRFCAKINRSRPFQKSLQSHEFAMPPSYTTHQIGQNCKSGIREPNEIQFNFRKAYSSNFSLLCIRVPFFLPLPISRNDIPFGSLFAVQPFFDPFISVKSNRINFQSQSY
jgi:hypothetical protein